MKNIITIIKKELLRVFKDPKLIVVVLLLPGLLIFTLYSIMGNVMQNAGKDETPLIVYTVNMPEDVKAIFDIKGFDINAEYTVIPLNKVDADKDKVKNKEIDLILVFEDNFLGKLSEVNPPKVTIYYNPTAAKSDNGFQKINAALSTLNPAAPQLFSAKLESVYDEKIAIGQTFAMLVPFVIISLLFSGCMSVAPDSIAGEKERGTMATLLKTPVKRREIAIGKIAALSILAIINAISSFIGLMLSMPKLMGMGDMTAIYGFKEYALILLVIISTVLIIISVMSVISSFARTVKEANMLIMPFMLVSMVVGITSLISSGAASAFYLYLIPLYNSVQSITAVLTFNINIVNLIITTAVNIVYAGIFIFVLSKLFNREKIMFAK